MHKLVLIVALSYTFLSCTKNVNITSTTAPKPVVEAFLQPGKMASIKITSEILYNATNTASAAINGLLVTVTASNGITYVFTQAATGEYINATMPVIAGNNYQLSFTYNNLLVTANTTVPLKPQNFKASVNTLTIPTFGGGGGFPVFPEPIKLSWSNPQQVYHYNVIKCIENNPQAISNAAGRPNIASKPDIASSKDINFTEFKYYGKNALVLVSILPEYAALYESNNSNSQNLSTVPTNLTNGLGIFTAINTADTLIVTVN
jgi:hypothetical protein